MRATNDLRQTHPSARWTRPDQLHLTLVFLGSLPVVEVGRIDAAVARVAASWRPFAVTMGGGDGFTERRRGGGVAWLRVADGYDEAARLSHALDEAIGASAFRDVAPRPHLTLARGIDRQLLSDLRAGSVGDGLGWPIDNVVLFRSHTGHGGSRYEALSRHPLGGL